MRLQLNEKKSKESQTRLNELILKTKADLKEGPDKTIVILALYFLSTDWLLFGEGWVRLKLDVPGQGDDGAGGGGGGLLEEVWT